MKKGVILFVDDEIFILNTLRVIFRREFAEYHLEVAQTPSEAMEILNSYKPEELGQLVVFSDWLMPEKRGDELLAVIHEKYPQSVNFLLSGMISIEANKQAFEKGGIKQVIYKPWDNDQLIKILKETLAA